MRPGPRLLPLALIWLGLSVLAIVWEPGHALWFAAGGVAGLACLTDIWSLYRMSFPSVSRRMPHSLALGVWSDIGVRLSNATRMPVTVDVFDHYPTEHAVTALPQTQTVPSEGWAEIHYRFFATMRGEHNFYAVQLLMHSPLGLWRRSSLALVHDAVRVYPNFSAVAKYALMATDNRLSQMGVRKRRRRGEGLEFHQLREYRPGDSLRQVDWKATSRHRKLISREYQDSRDQQIVFMIDCGRRMTARDDDLSHFDHTLNSVLLLSYVALRQGDAVGLMTFSGERRYIAPRKGAGMVNTVLNSIYDLQPSMQSPDYASAATELHKRLRKRSLVVMVTNLRDEDAGEVLPALNLLGRRHLVLLASLRESVLASVLAQPVNDFDDALRLSATQRYLLARRKVHDAVSKLGAMSLDVEPEKLPISMVNRYLDIKLSGRL